MVGGMSPGHHCYQRNRLYFDQCFCFVCVYFAIKSPLLSVLSKIYVCLSLLYSLIRWKPLLKMLMYEWVNQNANRWLVSWTFFMILSTPISSTSLPLSSVRGNSKTTAEQYVFKHFSRTCVFIHFLTNPSIPAAFNIRYRIYIECHLDELFSVECRFGSNLLIICFGLSAHPSSCIANSYSN